MQEEIIQDRLENNLIKCFSVLHKTLYVLGSTRVIIKDRVVERPNNGWLNLYSFFLVLCALFSETYLQVFYFDAFFHRNAIMYYTSLFGTVTQYLSYIMSLISARFTKVEENVIIYSKLQKIDRILKLSHDSYYTDFQAKVQNGTLLLICVFFPIGFYTHSAGLMDKPIYTALLAPALLILYLDLLLYGSLIYFIAVRVSIFNKMMKNHIDKCLNEQPELKLPKTAVQMFLSLLNPSYDRIEDTLELNRWSECIQELLKSYKMINDIFNFQVSCLPTSAVYVTM